MPIYNTWLVPGRIVYQHNSGHVTTAEVQQSDAELNAYCDAARAPVHVLADSSTLRSMPNVQQMRQMRVLGHERLGWYVVVGVDNRVLRVIGTVVGQLTQTPHRFFNHMPDALLFLQRSDSLLPDLTLALDNLNNNDHLRHVG